MDHAKVGEDAVRVALITVPYVAVASMLALFGLPAISWLDSWINPVLDDFRVYNVRFEQDRRICWHMDWRKNREALPAQVRFFIRVGPTGAPIPVIAYRDGNPMMGRVRPVGHAAADFCVDFPNDIPIGTQIIVTSHVVYDLPHGLWQLRQDFPDVRVN